MISLMKLTETLKGNEAIVQWREVVREAKQASDGWRDTMSKRGNNEGSVYKRADGRCAGAVTLEARKRRTFYGKTRQEVANKLTAALRDVEAGVAVTPERQTVQQFVVRWLETARPTLEYSTFVRYEEYMRIHVVPALGRIRLARLSAQNIQELYSGKLADGLSPTTVRHLHTVLHRALRQAVRWGLVSRNVTEMVDPPRMVKSHHQALTADQAKHFLVSVREDQMEALYVLAIMTGMRLGELLGLHWHEVDLDKETLQVRSQLKRGGVLGSPKTDSSRRQLNLPAIAIEALRRQRTRQFQERFEAGAIWSESDLVFTNSVGNAINPANLRNRSFIPLLNRARLPIIRFHDLRHSTATLLLSLECNPKVVQELLGHSQIGVTMDVYSHALPTMQKDAMSALNRLPTA